MPPSKAANIKNSIASYLNETPTWGIILVLSSGYFLLLVFTYHFVYTEAILWDRFEHLGSHQVIEDLIQHHKDKRWIYYLVHQALILTKVGAVTFTLYTSSFIYEAEVSLIQLLKQVAIAEFVILFYELLKMIWVVGFSGFNSFEQAFSYAPFSLAELLSTPLKPLWKWHLLSSINLFELLYFVVLFQLFHMGFDHSVRVSFKTVALGYTSALSIWLTILSTFLIYAEIPA